jgi:N-acetylneuraminic acid mutarotase
MMSIEETLAAMQREMRPLLETAMEGVLTKARNVLEELEQQCIEGLADANAERARGLTEVAEERAKMLAEVDARRSELHREILAMQTHQERQQGRVELNIGGYRFQTSVQTLRRVPHTFFDAYFSGRYAQDVCNDGSIFVDRDGEHFGHVLEYMRDGVVSVAEPGALPSVSLLRALKREFGFYCIELSPERPLQLHLPEMAYMLGGENANFQAMSSVERYDASSGQWSTVAAMGTARGGASACSMTGMIYVTGGTGGDVADALSSVEKYSPASNTWSCVAPMPEARYTHAAVAVGSAMYVLGGLDSECYPTESSFKFDSMQDSWSEVASMPKALHTLAACAVGNNIYAFGGGGEQSVYKYDTITDVWSNLGPMPVPCEDHSASVVDGFIYIVGAGYGTGVLRFDTISHAWFLLAHTSVKRDFGASFVMAGSLFVSGGRHSRASMERYDVAADTWTAVASMREGRDSFAAVSIKSAGPTEDQDLFDALIATA